MSNLCFSECNTELRSLRELLLASKENLDGRVAQVQTVSSEENLFLSEKNLNDSATIVQFSVQPLIFNGKQCKVLMWKDISVMA